MPKEDRQKFNDMFTEYMQLSFPKEESERRAELCRIGSRGNQVAPGVIIWVTDPDKIGKNIVFNFYTYVNGDVAIGDNVLIGPHTSLVAGNHKFDPKTGWFSARTEGDGDDSIVIGEGSWLAGKVTVTGGVKIGKANLICAGAVVTKSTPDYAIMAGVPAKQIGEIDPKTGEYRWFKKEK